MNAGKQGRRLTGLKRRTAAVAVLVLGAFAAIFLMRSGTPAITSAFWSAPADQVREKSWQAVAPGRVEPCSGQIRVAAGAVGIVDKVLVKANDKVFAGEALIHLADDELKARLAAADAQVSMRERARDEKSATGSAKTRRNAEDAVADA